MRNFEYRDNELYVDDVLVEDIAAEYGTPVYIYSLTAILENYRALAAAFGELDCLICYSVKANSNMTVLSALCEQGAGFDVVSGGELRRALKAGADPKRIVYAGVGKTTQELNFALDVGILMFNVESAEELQVLDELASELGRKAPAALRINPDVDAHTHRHITTGKKENKFGIDPETAMRILEGAKQLRSVDIVGLHMHIGSQITETDPYASAIERLAALAQGSRLLGHEIQYLNAGGGFGIQYETEDAPPAAVFAEAIAPTVQQTGCKLLLEPGRFIVGNAGILATRVQYIKRTDAKRFIITDAAMNDLMRPTLYGAYHMIWPASSPVDTHLLWEEHGVAALANLEPADVVGPVCESGDVFAKDRYLPEVFRDDVLAIFSAGAYGMSMSSNYNSRYRAAEVLVHGEEVRLVRRRETFEDIIAQETGMKCDADGAATAGGRGEA